MNRRRPAFDPSRLDDLDDLLPPSPPAATPRPDSAASVTPPTQRAAEPSPATASPANEPEPPRKPRGQGGRPTAKRETGKLEPEAGSLVAVAVRIPRGLYNDVNITLLAGPERPSYGQIVSWTCEDHADRVARHVRAARPRAGERRPRGRRLAADTVQVTLRMTAEERALLDEIIDQVRSTHGGLVTRTDVAAAALHTALSNPPA